MSDEPIFICDYPGVVDSQLVELFQQDGRKLRQVNSLELFNHEWPEGDVYLAGVIDLAQKFRSDCTGCVVHVRRDLGDFVGRHLNYLYGRPNLDRPTWVGDFQSYLTWIFSAQTNYLIRLIEMWQKKNRESVLSSAHQINFSCFNGRPNGTIKVIGKEVKNEFQFFLEEDKTHQLITMAL